jgi:hypothetical protein
VFVTTCPKASESLTTQTQRLHHHGCASEARRQGTAKRPGLKRASGGSAKCRVDQVATDQQLRLASYIVTDHNASTGGYCPAGKVSVYWCLLLR